MTERTKDYYLHIKRAALAIAEQAILRNDAGIDKYVTNLNEWLARKDDEVED